MNSKRLQELCQAVDKALVEKKASYADRILICELMKADAIYRTQKLDEERKEQK